MTVPYGLTCIFPLSRSKPAQTQAWEPLAAVKSQYVVTTATPKKPKQKKKRGVLSCRFDFVPSTFWGVICIEFQQNREVNATLPFTTPSWMFFPFHEPDGKNAITEAWTLHKKKLSERVVLSRVTNVILISSSNRASANRKKKIRFAMGGWGYSTYNGIVIVVIVVNAIHYC